MLHRIPIDLAISALTRSLKPTWRSVARPKQLAPGSPGSIYQSIDDWFIWLILTGRGFGKTRAGQEWLNEEALKLSQGDQVLIAGRTPADVRDYALKGPGGLLSHHPEVKYFPSKRLLVWPNGVEGLIRSGANPQEFRGFSGSTAWLDEWANWQYPEDAYNNLIFGMRENKRGAQPRICITTTPRPIKKLTEISKANGTVLVTGSSYENKDNLAEAWVRRVLDPLKGTRLGKQEILGKILEEVEGALFTEKLLELSRCFPGDYTKLIKIAIGVDPQGKKDVNPKIVEGVEAPKAITGIVASGLGDDRHLYCLEDASINGDPFQWGSKVIDCYHRWDANMVVGETNFGGDLVQTNVCSIDRSVPFFGVHASKNKVVRGEPIASVFYKGMGHMVGVHPLLEEECTTYTIDSKWSPNRLDGFVWGAWWLLGLHKMKSNKKTRRRGTF